MITKKINTGAALLYSKAKSTPKQNLYKYPSDLFTPGAEPYVLFTIKDSVARNGATKGIIATYMPPTMRVKYGLQYEELSLDWEKFKALSDVLMIDGASRSDLEKMGTGAADAIFGTNTGASYDIATGRIVNPHMALLFKGPSFREFQFEFHFMAKNKEESDAIKNIIYQFKYAAHPSVNNDAAIDRYLNFPENFTIEFFSPKDEYLFKITPCALTNMEVDYAGSGVPSFFTNTGAPVDVRMSLQFKELAIVTKQSIQEKGA